MAARYKHDNLHFNGYRNLISALFSTLKNCLGPKPKKEVYFTPKVYFLIQICKSGGVKTWNKKFKDIIS